MVELSPVGRFSAALSPAAAGRVFNIIVCFVRYACLEVCRERFQGWPGRPSLLDGRRFLNFCGGF